MRQALFGLLCLSVSGGACFAQDDAVVITATRFVDIKRNLPVGVTIIDADDLRKSATSNLPEILAQFGLVQVRDAAGTPNQQIDLRGFGTTGDQNTLVLLDGVRISENELVPAQLSAIPLESIERIEIVRGSGAVLYGSGATAGTVNIITRRPAPDSTRAHGVGRFGGYGTGELRAGLARAGEALGVGVDLSHEDTEGYRRHNRFRQTNAATTLSAAGRDGRAHLRVAAGKQSVELPGALTEAQIAADPRQAGTTLGEAERDDGSVVLGGVLSAGRHEAAADLAYREKRADARFTTPFAFLIDTRVRQTALTPRIKLRFDALERTHDLTLGSDLEEWHYANGARRGDHSSQALYALGNFWLGERTRLVLGARQQRSEQTLDARTDRHTLEAYEAAVRQGLGGGWSLYGKYGSSFRVATFDDILFTATPLQPQTAKTGEVGVEAERGGLRARVAIYDMRLENEIAFSPAAGPFGANVNLEPTRRRGVELEASWRVWKGLELRAALGLLQAEFRDGREVPLVPEAVATAGASWSITDQTRLNVNARYVGEQRYDNDQANTFRRQPAYGLLDAKLEHRVRRVTVALEVRNLLDEGYYSYGILAPPSFSAYPQPGRAVYLSLAYRLD